MLKWKVKGFDVPGLPSGKHDAPDRSEHADLLPDVVALWAITFDVGEFRSLLPVESGGAFSRHSQQTFFWLDVLLQGWPGCCAVSHRGLHIR